MKLIERMCFQVQLTLLFIAECLALTVTALFSIIERASGLQISPTLFSLFGAFTLMMAYA
jgi:hypothetical protein